MLTRCEKCNCAYLIKMETATNTVTGKTGMIVCSECKHVHPWPDKK